MVVTLLVVPAMGASMAVTEPLLPARPESGSCAASVCCGCAALCAEACVGMAMVAMHASSAIAAMERIGATLIFE